MMNKSFIRLFVALLVILTPITNAMAKTKWRNGAVIGAGTGVGVGIGVALANCTNTTDSCAASLPLFSLSSGLFGLSLGALIGEAFEDEELEMTYARRGFWTGEIAGLLTGLVSATVILSAPDIGSGDSDGVPELTAAILSTILLPGVFGLIGWGIGSGIQKNATVSLYPILLEHEGAVSSGVGLKIEF